MLRVVIAYCPYKPSNVDINFTYTQQELVFVSHNDDRCPRRVFFVDLAAEYRTWNKSGDQLVIMGSFNEDVTSPVITCMFSSLVVYDVIIVRHPYSPLQLTWNRGSVPIDRIFISRSIHPTVT